MRTSAPCRQAGFTLLETLVATAVGIVAVGAFRTFDIAQMYAMRNQSSQVDLQTNGRTIADLFAREVRRAGTLTNPSCTGTASTGLIMANSSQVQIRANIDGTPGTTGSNEDVTYTLNFGNNQVTRTDNNAARTDVLWSGGSIAGSQITYFDSNGTQISPGSSNLSAAQLAQVVRVRLQLALTANPSQAHNSVQQTVSDTADAALRNRYFVNGGCPYPNSPDSASPTPTPFSLYN